MKKKLLESHIPVSCHGWASLAAVHTVARALPRVNQDPKDR